MLWCADAGLLSAAPNLCPEAHITKCEFLGVFPLLTLPAVAQRRLETERSSMLKHFSALNSIHTRAHCVLCTYTTLRHEEMFLSWWWESDTYSAVLIDGFQPFHGHVSDVASSEQNLACRERKNIMTNTFTATVLQGKPLGMSRHAPSSHLFRC